MMRFSNCAMRVLVSCHTVRFDKRLDCNNTNSTLTFNSISYDLDDARSGCSNQSGVLVPRTSSPSNLAACTVELLQSLGTASTRYTRWGCLEEEATNECWVYAFNNALISRVQGRPVASLIQYICEGTTRSYF